MRLEAVAPQAMNNGPIMNSVPAVCSPAYMPQKELGPLSLVAGTGSRSNSLDEAVITAGVGADMGF